jgi:GTPase SAR1 family protein
MLIGQDRAGKTSLKKSLLGLSFDPKEPSTDGVDVDPSRFYVNVDNVIDWQISKDNSKNEFDDSITHIMVEILDHQGREARESDPALGQPKPQKVCVRGHCYG